MEEIKPSGLSLFENYLLDLQKFTVEGEKDHKFYKRWKSKIEQITEISKRFDSYLAEKDSEAAHQVKFSKHLSFHNNEYTVFEKHITYYLSGIKTYKEEAEATLLHGDLLDKKVQEMTGFELKTLLLITLKEHRDRQ